MNKLGECNNFWSCASDVNFLAVHSQGGPCMKYFNLWGLLTFYLYKDNAILFMKGFVAS